MSSKLSLWLAPGFDRSLVPVPAARLRHWWEDNRRTADHAKHCLPLTMANCLGHFILSPGTFSVAWDGNPHAAAKVTIHEAASHCEIDNHAAFGSFTVQAKFIPVTYRPGDFVYIKGVANERGMPYSCMEALIEAWWSRGEFGLVYLLNRPGEILVYKGQPIAQFFIYKGEAGAASLELEEGFPEGYMEWKAKRSRPGYKKDLDYLNGRLPNQESVPTHITQWSKADCYETGH